MNVIDDITTRLRSDPEFFERLRTDPRAALDGYDLDDEVRAAFAHPGVLAIWTAVTSAQITWASFPVAVHSGPRPVPPTPPVVPAPPTVPEPVAPILWATSRRD